MPICFRLFELWMRPAASRTFCTAGNNKPTRTAMIAITTNNSIRVNALRRERTEIPPREQEQRLRITSKTQKLDEDPNHRLATSFGILLTSPPDGKEGSIR